jgi:hypothetical protein
VAKRLSGIIVLALVLATLSAPAARAAGPSLKVTNLGQESAPVEVGQPAIEIAATNGCAHPFTLANESACPPGTWPPLGRQWGLIEDVAGGDTLRFEFSSPVAAVSVGSTSNYEPGLHDPDGKSIPNYDVMPESAAVASGDPAVWQVTLPPLDARAITGQGYTFSVVAQDESGFHGFPFGIRSPRYADESTKCGRAFFSTGWEQGLCSNGTQFPKGIPQIFRVSKATYDGRILILHLEVPEAGELSLGIPVSCHAGRAADCHMKTSISRYVPRQDDLVIRRRLVPRLDARHHLNLSARLEMADGGLMISSLRPKVHRVKPR